MRTYKYTCQTSLDKKQDKPRLTPFAYDIDLKDITACTITYFLLLTMSGKVMNGCDN